MLPDIDLITSDAVDSILLFSFQNRIPVFSFTGRFVKMGAVAAVSADAYDLGMYSAELVLSRVVRGASENPAHLHPRKVNLSVNRKIAEKFGIRLDEKIIQKASEVF